MIEWYLFESRLSVISSAYQHIPQDCFRHPTGVRLEIGHYHRVTHRREASSNLRPLLGAIDPSISVSVPVDGEEDCRLNLCQYLVVALNGIGIKFQLAARGQRREFGVTPL